LSFSERQTDPSQRVVRRIRFERALDDVGGSQIRVERRQTRKTNGVDARQFPNVGHVRRHTESDAVRPFPGAQVFRIQRTPTHFKRILHVFKSKYTARRYYYTHSRMYLYVSRVFI